MEYGKGMRVSALFSIVYENSWCWWVFFQWTTFCSQVCIHDFFTAMEVVCLYLQDDFVPPIFLEILCKSTEKKKKVNIKLNVIKLVNLLAVWSLELFKTIFHVSNYFWERVLFECHLSSCFYFGEMEAMETCF